MSNSKNKICSYHWSLKWILLISIQLQNTAGNSVQLVSSSIPFETAAYFNTTVDSINNVFISTNLGNVLALLPMVLVTDFYGPTPNFYLSGIGAIITTILRIISVIFGPNKPGFILYIASQFLVILQMQSSTVIGFMLINLWFPPKWRTFANNINGLSPVAGFVLAMVLGPIFVKEGSGYGDFLNLTLVQCGLSVFSLILQIIFLILEGHYSCILRYDYPSVTSQQLSEKYLSKNFKNLHLFKNEFIETLKQMKAIILDWRGYLCVTLTFSIPFVTGEMILVGLPQILCPKSYEKFFTTVGLSCIFLVSGCIFGSITAYINDKYNKGIVTLKTLLVFLVGYVWIVFYFVTYCDRNEVVLSFLFILFGLAFAVVPLTMEFSIECTYPIKQGLVNGLFNAICCFCQFAIGIVFFLLPKDITDQAILDDNTCNVGRPEDSKSVPQDFTVPLIFLFGLFSAFVFYPIIFLKVPFKRKNIDNEKI